VSSTLPAVSHEHHDRLHAIVDELYALGDCSDSDCMDTTRLNEARPAIERIHAGLVTYLIPHMEAVEAAVHPVLERLLAGTGSIAIMEHDHAEIRRLTAVIGEFVDHPGDDVHRGTVLLMRRALLRLCAVLRTHLAEEALYIPIMEDRLTEAQAGEIAMALDHVAVRLPGIA
jgi:hypothetical protein